MEFLARKFSRSKWESDPFAKDDENEITTSEIAAHPVTACLRTPDNTLSFWLCSTKERQDIEDIVLAMASAPDYSHLEKMHFITIPRAELEARGLSLEPTPGKTFVEDLKDRHINLVNLSLGGLSKIAILMAYKVRRESDYCHTFPKAEVRKIIKIAISQNRLSIDRLAEKVRREIEKMS